MIKKKNARELEGERGGSSCLFWSGTDFLCDEMPKGHSTCGGAVLDEIVARMSHMKAAKAKLLLPTWPIICHTHLKSYQTPTHVSKNMTFLPSSSNSLGENLS